MEATVRKDLKKRQAESVAGRGIVEDLCSTFAYGLRVLYWADRNLLIIVLYGQSSLVIRASLLRLDPSLSLHAPAWRVPSHDEE